MNSLLHERNGSQFAKVGLDDFLRRLERLPVILMALRLLDRWARYDREIKAIKLSSRPYATAWLRMLGELLHDRRREAKVIHYDLTQKAEQLADRPEEDYSESACTLRDAQSEPNVVLRLAESLTPLQGRANTQENLVKLFDSALLMGRPNGLGSKRVVTQSNAARRRRDLRSLVFTDSVLDYLVHLHVLPSGNRHGARPLALKEFLRKVQDRYGVCVDESPVGMTISNELLQANRRTLERRLRDLGVLVGVNDAESMKRLQPRFAPAGEEERHALD